MPSGRSWRSARGAARRAPPAGWPLIRRVVVVDDDLHVDVALRKRACRGCDDALVDVLFNLVNADDARELGRKILSGEAPRAVRRAGMGSRARTEAAWAHTGGPPVNSWDVPAVRERTARKATGDPAIHHADYIADRYLAHELRGISVGCGSGVKEVAWAQTGRFASIDGYDVSVQRIEHARDQHGNETLRFHVGDVLRLDLVPGSVDVVIGEDAVHHLAPMRAFVDGAYRALKSGGLVVLNEYVGPNRFQYTDRQLEAMTGLLMTMPERLRVLWGTDRVKRRAVRPSILRMLLADPSESAQSSSMLPLMGTRFQTVEVRELGGTLIDPLLSGIAHHFLSPDDPEAANSLERCFAVEHALIHAGEIGSDHVLAVYRKA